MIGVWTLQAAGTHFFGPVDPVEECNPETPAIPLRRALTRQYSTPTPPIALSEQNLALKRAIAPARVAGDWGTTARGQPRGDGG